MKELTARVLLLYCWVFSLQSKLFASSQCTQGNLRLVGGSGNYEGNLQVCHNNQWGWVCDSSWDSNDAIVACQQLGFSTSNVVARYNSFYGYGNGTKHLDYLYCNGNEEKLVDCSKGYSLGIAYCGASDVAGLFCPFGNGCTYGDIRLANFYSSSYGRSEGRVEVCYNNEWGTVCNNYWGGSDAQVACRQLGYDGYWDYFSYSYFGYGSGSIWLNYLQCSGGENSLFNCPKSLGSQSCSHSQDVGVRCYSHDNSPCTNNQFRLWSAYDSTPEHEGLMQICRYGTWYTMHDYSDCDTVRLVCISLGYSGARTARYNAALYYGYYYYRDDRYWHCNTYASSLSNCHYHYTGNSYYNHMGVVCYNPSAGGSCTDGDVRLVNGDTSDEGRVEYCYDGGWAPVCSLNSYTASLMCKKLGYTDYSWSKIISNQEFGRSNTESYFNYINCYSWHTDLSDCYVYTKGGWGSCYVSLYTCGTEYGLRCYNAGDCKDGDVRLVDGLIDQEGRPEVCINGVWGTICDYSWNSVDAYVFCNKLGYDGPYPYTYCCSHFGDGYGPAVWSYVNCQGWEHDIHDCSKNVYPNVYCSQWSIAGVGCRDACEYGDVRLVGGGFPNEGTVEVCGYNIWGQIGDHGWTDGDATVVCNQLGYTDGIAKPVKDSYYGKGRKIIAMRDVSCTGNEKSISECTRTDLYYWDGRRALNSTEVAGVDCIYDEPTEPPCIVSPDIDPSDACDSIGSFRLSGISDDEGRVEYCYDNFWTPLCFMDHKTAAVACGQLGFNQYTWGAIIDDGRYGALLNYSLIQNITCTGSESSLSNCTTHPPDGNCLPWCPNGNIGLKCYDPIPCQEGSMRLADGFVDQEGRVEVCVNGVWGAICDDEWDKTDAHIACQQLGHPELEPVLFKGSYFGGGDYPIVFSEMKCGGWEDSLFDCSKQNSFLDITCSRSNIAGVLCGYDCQNGDVRLVGGEESYEGSIEICYNNLWGLVSEEGWTVSDAQVVCRELGYEVEGTESFIGSQYGKPEKIVHLSNVQCHGDETSINECIKTIHSLTDGKEKAKTDEVAGVKCYQPSDCVPPPTGGSECVDKEIRLVGSNANSGEGALEYCYQGLWTRFCFLGTNEASIACQQLGYDDLVLASVFTDGRFNTEMENSNSSYIQNISCSSPSSTDSLGLCTVYAKCQTTCKNTVGLKCFANDKCEDGNVRLMDGAIDQEGRVEVCHSNVWGSICSNGFDLSDAYVVCKELRLGVSKPSLASFGDGNVPIAYSKLECNGYEASVFECSREEYGSFDCSRDAVAGIVCQDGCMDGEVKLVGGRNPTEGTVEICYRNLWGLILTTDWDDTDAAVVCSDVGYVKYGAVGFTDSRYGKPNKTVHLSNVACNGSESALNDCDAAVVSYEGGRNIAIHVDVVGVSCKTAVPSVTVFASGISQQSDLENHGVTAGLAIFSVLLVIIILLAVSMIIYIIIKKSRSSSTNNEAPIKSYDTRFKMSSANEGTRTRGVVNPIASTENEDQIDEDQIDEDFDDILEKSIIS